MAAPLPLDELDGEGVACLSRGLGGGCCAACTPPPTKATGVGGKVLALTGDTAGDMGRGAGAGVGSETGAGDGAGTGVGTSWGAAFSRGVALPAEDQNHHCITGLERNIRPPSLRSRLQVQHCPRARKFRT